MLSEQHSRLEYLKIMMKASRIHGYGGPEAIHYEDAAPPSPGPGEVLVCVHAMGVNPVDWKIRDGFAKAMFETKFPAILGGELAGVVEEVGPDVEDWKAGDEIFAMIGLLGANAEYVVTKAAFLAPKPRNMSFVQAAAIPLAGLTAWLALIDTAELSSGQRVLIHAAAGGVGSFAVQIAHYAGAYIVGTASAENAEYLRSIGTQETIDYRVTKFEDVVRDMDVVLDLIGGTTQSRSFSVLKPGGFLVSTTSPIDRTMAEAAKVRVANVRVAPNGKKLAEIGKLVEAGHLRPEIAAIYPLSKAAEALELSKAGHTRGKIVLTARD
jgi:NADPH:quinone reductase-like Zn-dependent oxidoreductase